MKPDTQAGNVSGWQPGSLYGKQAAWKEAGKLSGKQAACQASRKPGRQEHWKSCSHPVRQESAWKPLRQAGSVANKEPCRMSGKQAV